MNSKTEEQLNSYISDLESKVSSLESSLEIAKKQLDAGGLKWLIHREVEQDETLPVPRLQIECEKTDCGWLMEYAMVTRHFLGHIVIIPLGLTTRRGNCEIGDLPYRDGAHIKHDMKQLNLPAHHVVIGKGSVEIKAEPQPA